MDFFKNLFTKNTSYNPNNPSSNRYVPFDPVQSGFLTPSTKLNTTSIFGGTTPKTTIAPVITPTQQITQATGGAKPVATTTPQANPTVPNLNNNGGLTLAERNNNPGNLRFINQPGAIMGDNGFAKFNDPNAGFNALVNDLKSKMTGATSTGLTGNSTLQDLIGVYAPKGDGNDPLSYANFVSQKLGVPVNTPISAIDPTKLATAMAFKEDVNYANKLTQSGVLQALTGGATVDTSTPEGLAKAAAQAGLSLDDFMKIVQGNNAIGSADYKNILNDLGIPGLVDKTYNNPAPNLVALYNDNYNALGLGDIKNKVADIDAKIVARRQALQGAISDTTNDAWTSGATKDARIARDKEIAAADIQNLLTQRESLVGQYDTGVNEIEKRISNASTMFNNQNSLDASKLNFLLNMAEKQANLITTDNTKKTYRYAGTYLTEKRTADQQKADEALQRDIKKEQAKNNVGSFDTLNALTANKPSVLPYAKVATTLYNDLGTSNDARNINLKNLVNSLNTGDMSVARGILTSAAAEKLTGDSKSKFEARAQTINLALNIKERLEKYVARTGDTNLLTGTWQNIQQKLGTSGDPEAASINSDMNALLQEMRANVTGAAWGVQEDAEYAKQAPTLSNTSTLNLALLDGLVNRLNVRQKSAINTYLNLSDTDFNQVFGGTYNPVGSGTQISASQKLDALLGGGSAGGGTPVTSTYSSTLDSIWNGGN